MLQLIFIKQKQNLMAMQYRLIQQEA